jgi:hypothetical protein
MNETGWQDDGSYVPCPECGYTPAPDNPDMPGVAIHIPGTIHESSCPKVPNLSPEAADKLREKLKEMDRVRARGWAEARNAWIY